MPQPIRPSLTVLVVAAVVATLSLTAAASAGAATAPKWKVGDCYSDAQIDFDEVNLASAVDCTKDHEAQIVGGAPLPAALASAPLADLTSTTSALRPQVVAFAAQTCSPAAVAKTVYPKQGAALSPLFTKYGVTDWTVPAPGSTGWALPDAASYDAGTKALLCVFAPSAAGIGTTAGDIRKVSTPTPVATRLCFDFNAANTATVYQPCAKTHDIESLIWVALPITSQPADPTTWQDADWAPFDAACAEFAAAVVGAKRADFKFNADTDPGKSPSNGKRMFNCRAYPTKTTAAIAANAILAGAGKAKIKLATT